MISVIMPTYNRKDMMKQAVESIFMQSFKELEVVIVDDCSSDDTQSVINALIAEGKKIVYHRNDTNRGPGYNRNLGYKLSKGEYIVFMDDDDYYTDKDFYSKVMGVFRREERLACVEANSMIENVYDNTFIPTDIGFSGRKNGIDYLLEINGKYKKPMSTFATVFSRKYLEKADLINMKMVNDIAIYMRVLVFGDVFVIPDLIGNYRIHSNNISSRIEVNFLIENIKERFWVANRLPIGKREKYQWLDKQIIFCFSYFVKGSHPKSKEIMKLTIWIICHSHLSLHLYKRIIGTLLRDRKKSLY